MEGYIEKFDCHDMTWYSYQDESGHIYYLDSTCQYSQWEDPRESGVIQSSYGEENESNVNQEDEQDVEEESHDIPTSPVLSVVNPSRLSDFGNGELESEREVGNGPINVKLFDDDSNNNALQASKSNMNDNLPLAPSNANLDSNLDSTSAVDLLSSQMRSLDV